LEIIPLGAKQLEQLSYSNHYGSTKKIKGEDDIIKKV
jgi:hypothetical protein